MLTLSKLTEEEDNIIYELSKHAVDVMSGMNETPYKRSTIGFPQKIDLIYEFWIPIPNSMQKETFLSSRDQGRVQG